MTTPRTEDQRVPRYDMVEKVRGMESWRELERDPTGEWCRYEDAVADRDAALKDLARAMGERNDKLEADFGAMVLACRQALVDRNNFALQLNAAIGGGRETFNLEQWLLCLTSELRATR